MRILLLLIILGAMTSSRAGEAGRETRPRFKGVELYAWRKATRQAWHFALLSGTNRLKTPAEIMAPGNTLEDVVHLKAALAQLAVGEQVSWSAIERAHPTPPPAELVAEIQRAAAALQLKLGPLPPERALR